MITRLDITSRIDSEAEARKFATVLKNSYDAVVVFDLNGQITTWNSGASHMFGYTQAGVLQLNILDIVPSEGRDAMRAMFESSNSRMPSELIAMRKTSAAIRELQRKIRTMIRGLITQHKTRCAADAVFVV